MGEYIKPAKRVEEEGRKIVLTPTYAQASAQLQKGETAVALVRNSGFGLQALLATRDLDMADALDAGGYTAYAISAEIAALAQ